MRILILANMNSGKMVNLLTHEIITLLTKLNYADTELLDFFRQLLLNELVNNGEVNPS